MKRIVNNAKSFTLIELLAVLAIIGIILSICVPAFDSVLKTNKVNEGAKIIYRTLQFARQYAITHSTDTVVVLAISTPSGASYEMERRTFKVYVPGTGTIEDWKFLNKGTVIDQSSSAISDTTNVIPFPDDTSANGTVAYVRFNPTGRSTTRSTIRIIDANDNTVFREVTYDNTVGRITLKGLNES